MTSLTGMPSAVSSRASIAWQVPAATLLAAAGIAAAGLEPRALPLLYLAAVTPALCSADLRQRRLPNRLVLPGYLVAVAGVVAQWLRFGEFPVVSLIAGVFYLGFLLLLGVAGGMGMGDVKLAGVLGLAAGLLGPTAAIVSPVVAFLAGGAAGIVALRRGSGASIPFGPFMLAGFWVAVLLAVGQSA